MYEHILLATDGSEHATTAASHAIDLAERHGATLHGLYVVETRTAYDNALVNQEEVRENLRRIGENALDDIRKRADERGVSAVTSIEEGIPAERILDYASKNDVDFVFVGERGHSAFKTVLLGSTTETVIHESDVPVTVV